MKRIKIYAKWAFSPSVVYIFASGFCHGVSRGSGQGVPHWRKPKVRFLARLCKSDRVQLIVPFDLNRERFRDGLVRFRWPKEKRKSGDEPAPEEQQQNRVADSSGSRLAKVLVEVLVAAPMGFQIQPRPSAFY